MKLLILLKRTQNGDYHFLSIHEAGDYKVKVMKKTETQNPSSVQISKGGKINNIDFGAMEK